MKIVDRKSFLALPEGTLYMEAPRPYAWGEIQIKGETLANTSQGDWYESYLTMIENSGSDQLADRWDEMMEQGASYPLDLETSGRNGLYDTDAIFMIYEEADLVKLRDLFIGLAGNSPPRAEGGELASDLIRALDLALDHIEHMAAFITAQNAGYSFESLGEDMPGIESTLEAARTNKPSPGNQAITGQTVRGEPSQLPPLVTLVEQLLLEGNFFSSAIEGSGAGIDFLEWERNARDAVAQAKEAIHGQ